MRTPPDPSSFRPRDLSELAFLGRKMFEMSERQIYDMIRFWTMSISDYLDEYFESPVIKAYLAVSAIIGTALGPMSPGSAYVLLHHYMGEVDGNIGAWGFARGGMGSISKALNASFAAAGGEVRVGRGIEKIIVQNGRAVGVVLEGGDQVMGRRVISNMDVKRTFLKHVDEAQLPEPFVKRVRNFKIRGSSGKLNIALDAAPTFTALPEGAPNLKGDLHFTDSVERMERAYDDWKSGHFSADPFQDVMIPTMIDPTMVPAGKHFMSCFVQYAPPKIEGREWTDADRDAFGATCINQIEQYAPGFKNLILHAEVRTPRELEAEVGLTEGNIFQGELTFDQLLFNRPVPGYANYRSPIKDLWICGSSTHPGGGVMGAPGRNAAAEILRDARMGSKMSDAYAVL
jgi:phytoene dehydrogenase-like protein